MSSEAKIFIRRGISKTQTAEYSAAIEYYTKALELDPLCVEAYMERIYAKLELKDYKSADEDIANGDMVYPNFAKGMLLFDEANSHFKEGNYPLAIQRYNEVCELLPSLTNIYYLRGLAKKLSENYKAAIADFDLAIENDASNKAAAYFQRGKIKSMLREDSGAIKDYTHAIELSPKEEEYYYARAGVADNVSGIEDYTKAIELNPGNPMNYIARAVNRMLIEDHQNAFNDLSAYISIAPSDAYRKVSDAYYFRGRMRMHLLDVEGAIADWTKAIEVDSENADAYFNRGIIYEAMGNKEEAERDMEKARKLGYNG
jgi:tetratricopeptide (TPR) repeat protein